jgi:flagellar protein FliS
MTAMHAKNAAEAYLTSSIENAPPAKIVRMLYEGAIRFLMQAEEQDPSAAGSRFAELVGRADDIVVELRLCLSSEQAPELSENLRRLYLFCEDELSRALVERDASPLPGVRSVLMTLLEAWREVEASAPAGV